MTLKKVHKVSQMGFIMVQFVFKASLHFGGIYGTQKYITYNKNSIQWCYFHIFSVIFLNKAINFPNNQFM